MIVRTESDLRQALQLDSETEHIEFKEAKTDYDFEKLADYCCALANEGGGSMVLGVIDVRPRRIVGSEAFANLDRTKTGSSHASAGVSMPRLYLPQKAECFRFWCQAVPRVALSTTVADT